MADHPVLLYRKHCIYRQGDVVSLVLVPAAKIPSALLIVEENVEVSGIFGHELVTDLEPDVLHFLPVSYEYIQHIARAGSFGTYFRIGIQQAGIRYIIADVLIHDLADVRVVALEVALHVQVCYLPDSGWFF